MSMDPHTAFHVPARRSTAEQVEGLDLFASVDVPRIETPAPVAPGSATSQAWRKLMLALGAASRPLTMHELSEQTGIPINVVCARIPELEPLWIAREKRGGVSHVKPSLRVDAFTLTDAGRARLRGAA